MRQGKTLRCPSCTESPAGGATCHRCGSKLVDEHGNAPAPARVEYTTLGFGLEGASGLRTPELHGPPSSQFDGLAFLTGSTFGALACEVRELSHRRRMRRELRAAPLSERIGDAAEGWVRVRGEVVILVAARHQSTLESCAAYIHRERLVQDSGRIQITTYRGVGRFLVKDETGFALVDDDYVVLLNRGGGTPLATTSGGLVIRDGDRVEVAGTATRRVEPGISTRGRGAFRERETVLCFDGMSAHLLKIKALE